MFLGLDGVELSLIIVFGCLFAGILSGFPVAFAISGAAIVGFSIVAILSENGLLYVIEEYNGVNEQVPVLAQGWRKALLGTLSAWSQGVFARAFGGNIDTLLAVPLFVLMGITLERSRIAEDLLLTMASVFGALPGGLAISVVLVGTLLAASTGIVGATVVTMGLIALPTMLRHGYSKELSTGVIATSGTLGQIIPPSIVLVLLGSIVGDMYAIGQESRAKELGITVMEMLGEAAVVSTGTLFKAAFVPGLVLALLYAVYAFGYALLRPSSAPPVSSLNKKDYKLRDHYKGNLYLVFGAIMGPPILLVLSWVLLVQAGIVGSQFVTEGGSAPPIAHGTMVLCVLIGLLHFLVLTVRPHFPPRPVLIGLGGLLLMVAVDWLVVSPEHSPGMRFLYFALPAGVVIYALGHVFRRLMEIDSLRVISPPVILIVAVLGSILGGVTNPTAAAGLGATGAIMLAATRKLKEEQGGSRILLWASLGIVIMLLLRGNFDLRMTMQDISFENGLAIFLGLVAFHIAFFGLLYACWVLMRDGVMRQVVQETTKVTSMVFVILIGSLFLSLVVRSFGGEHYIQEFLRSFEDPRMLLIAVMAVLFLLGFVLDFIEIIFIVIPIVGPVIYAADPTLMPPEWITILIAVNLQTSFITPPFGFALFYLRGVAPPSVTTGDLYRGVAPFVVIQVVGLVILWYFPVITTWLPDLIPEY
jgi:TRAP-type mannitol/chloroaromatic compound transport system permease large subunit|tara:strand:+ start:4047 stop:6149 length:2103 start_codon:yes stop_codon:yes gene_type:complete